MRAVAFCLALWPGLALASPPLTAEEFDSYVTGQTITYHQQDTLFGIEEYLPGRKVRWQEAGKGCSGGTWFARDSAICFAYTGFPRPACWVFVQTGDRVVAHSLDDAPGEQPFQVTASDTPLDCSATGGG